MSTPVEVSDDLALFDALAATRDRLDTELGRVIVGQRRVVDLMLTALFAQGHCLFIGVPGLAKTLLVSSTAQVLGLAFNRIQFTPDLMPADITGTEVLDLDRESGERRLRFLRGPVFTNLLLADEVNRTPPKTQAALLQAMQERQVTAGGRTWSLEPPFQVFATQNPIEQEGTYPLPEAQLDRFMFAIEVGYPSEAEEVEVVKRTAAADPAPLAPVVDRATLLALQGLARRLPVSDRVVSYAVRLARATRPDADGPDPTRRWVQWGAGPRASQHLVAGARVWAALHGNETPHYDDVRAVAHAVLQHRIVLNFQAEAQQIAVGRVVDELLDLVKP